VRSLSCSQGAGHGFEIINHVAREFYANMNSGLKFIKNERLVEVAVPISCIGSKKVKY
jgi:hypothetical protein